MMPSKVQMSLVFSCFLSCFSGEFYEKPHLSFWSLLPLWRWLSSPLSSRLSFHLQWTEGRWQMSPLPPWSVLWQACNSRALRCSPVSCWVNTSALLLFQCQISPLFFNNGCYWYFSLYWFSSELKRKRSKHLFCFEIVFPLKNMQASFQVFFSCLFQSRRYVYCKVFWNCCLNLYLYLCVGFIHGLRDQSNMPKIYLMFHQSLGRQYTHELQNQTDNWEQQMSFTWSLLSLSRTGSRCPQQDKIHN